MCPNPTPRRTHPLPDLSPHETVVVGDVDSQMFSRTALREYRIDSGRRLLETRPAPLGVWATGVWQRESTATRWAKSKLVHLVER